MPTQATKHAPTCKRAFSNYDNTCPRCLELNQGAKARQAWSAIKNKDLSALAKAIRAHDCKTSGCGPICTAFDW